MNLAGSFSFLIVANVIGPSKEMFPDFLTFARSTTGGGGKGEYARPRKERLQICSEFCVEKAMSSLPLRTHRAKTYRVSKNPLTPI